MDLTESMIASRVDLIENMRVDLTKSIGSGAASGQAMRGRPAFQHHRPAAAVLGDFTCSATLSRRLSLSALCSAATSSASSRGLRLRAHLVVVLSYLVSRIDARPETPNGEGGASWCSPSASGLG